MIRCLLLLLLWSANSFADGSARLKELDAYWKEVSRTVREGDFEGYKATCHPDGILIAGSKQTSYLLSDALKKWKPNFTKAKEGTMKASVEFRFSRRWGDTNTAHETGMFRYAETDAEGKEQIAYINLVALLIKKDGKWLVLMENQASEGTIADWKKLKPAE
jgi:hypothetical protein